MHGAEKKKSLFGMEGIITADRVGTRYVRRYVTLPGFPFRTFPINRGRR